MIKFEELLKISLNCDVHKNITVMDTEQRELNTSVWRCYLCNPSVLYVDTDTLVVSPEDFNQIKIVSEMGV